MTKPFQPSVTATLAVTDVSGSVAISPAAETLELQNAGGAVVFVRWSNVAPTAVVTDYPVLPGQSKTMTCGSGNLFIAAIAASGETSTLYVTSGEGI